MLKDVAVGLVGEHQAENVAAAVAAVMQLRQQGWQVHDEAVVQGLQEAWLPGRFQVGDSAGGVLVDWWKWSGYMSTEGIADCLPSKQHIATCDGCLVYLVFTGGGMALHFLHSLVEPAFLSISRLLAFSVRSLPCESGASGLASQLCPYVGIGISLVSTFREN